MASRFRTIVYSDVTARPAKAYAGVTIGAGKRKVVKLPVYSEGKLHRVYVKQYSGTGAGFTVDVLCSDTPYGDGSEAEAAYNAATAINPGLFKVMDQQTATAGNAVDWRSQDDSSGSDGHPFMNVDQVSITENQPYLYLVIIPSASADASVWEVSVTYEISDNN